MIWKPDKNNTININCANRQEDLEFCPYKSQNKTPTIKMDVVFHALNIY